MITRFSSLRPVRHLKARRFTGSQIEALESRIAPALVTSFIGGVLTVTSDEVGDSITISNDGTNILLNSQPIVGLPTLGNTASIQIVGNGGDDLITINASNGLFVNGANDIAFTIDGGEGNDGFIYLGSTGTDSIDIGANGIDFRQNGTVDATLTGLETYSFDGGIGDDVINAGGSVATGAAFASAVTLLGSDGNDVLTGGAGADFISGGANNDTLNGGAGDDVLTGGTGNDSFTGGGDTDTISETADTNFTLTPTTLTSPALGDDTILDVIEKVSLTGGTSANIIDASTFTGIATLSGLGGNDTLTGGLGNDILIGGAGDDSLNGGDGIDTIRETSDAATITLGATSLVAADLGTDTHSGIESVELTGGASANIFLVTDYAGSATIDGGGGQDIIASSGNFASVTLAAGTLTRTTGTDSSTIAFSNFEAATLEGGIGDNAFFVNGFTGAVTVSGGDGVDTIGSVLDAHLTLTDTALTPSVGGTISFGGIEAADLTGGESANIIDASAFTLGPVTIHGGGGNDTITGSAQADTLYGDDGDDAILGGAGNDTIFGGIGNDTITGGAGADEIHGNGSPAIFLTATHVEGGTLQVRGYGPDMLSGFFLQSPVFSTLQGINGIGFLPGGNQVLVSTISGVVTLNKATTQLQIGGIFPNPLAPQHRGDASTSGTLTIAQPPLQPLGGTLIITGHTLNPGGFVKTGLGTLTLQTDNLGNVVVAADTDDDTIVWNDGDGSDTIDGDDGTDTVQVHGSASAAGELFTVGANGTRLSVARANLTPFALDIGSVEKLDLDAGAGDDTIFVNDLSGVGSIATIVASGGDGDDFINTSALPVGLLASVTINGGAGDDILTGGAGVETIHGDAGVDRIDGNGGDDNLNGGDGDDLFLVNDGDGSDTIDGGAGSDQVQITGSGGDDHFVVSSGVVRSGDGTPALALTQTGSVEQITISAGEGSDELHVENTTAKITFRGEGGDDSVILSEGTNQGVSHTGGIVHLITVDGGTGTNSVLLSDTDGAPTTVTITPTHVGAGASDTFFGAGGSLEYTNIATLTVDLPDSNVQGDIVHVTPSATTAIAIHGNGPTAPTSAGDLLDLDLTGVTDAHLTTTGGSGAWTFANRATVSFTGIERLSNVDIFATATGKGHAPLIHVHDATTGDVKFDITPFASTFTGGVRVATGDVNGDGIADVVAGTGKGMQATVRVFDGLTGVQLTGALGEILPFGESTDGVFVAAGDVNHDGKADIIVGRGAGASRVKVYSGEDGTMLMSLAAFDSGFTGGVRVAAGDVNGDGNADIIATGGTGTTTTIVNVFSGATKAKLFSRAAFASTYVSGAYVAAGDLDGDGLAEVVVSRANGQKVRVFADTDFAPLSSFNAFDSKPAGGVRVAVSSATGQILAAGNFSVSSVRTFTPEGLFVDSFQPFPEPISGGIFVG